MAKPSKDKHPAPASATNPGAAERNRLRRLAFANNLLSETPARGGSISLPPSKTVVKHHGKDIIRKSNRKNRFLFSFPGLIGPGSGGKIGELKDLGSKNPVLYLDFPQGQVKLFGTIVYPKNKYLTLQFSRGGKNVLCEDFFDTMIVFSEAWWIGRKEDNPNEVRLEFPEDLNVVKKGEYDFKGGAGSACERVQGTNRKGVIPVKQPSSKLKLEGDSSDSEADLMQVTPTRYSARTVGKTIKYAEASSADDFVEIDADKSEGEEKLVEPESSTRNDSSGMTESSFPTPATCNKTPLVQATISTLFDKVKTKMVPEKLRHSPRKVSKKGLHDTQVEDKIDEAKVEAPRKKGKVTDKGKDGSRMNVRKTLPEVEDDDIEEFSSMSQDAEDESDEDWAG